MKMKIKVTKEILKRSMMCGIKTPNFNAGKNCPISLAVREIFPNAWVQTSEIIIDAKANSDNLIHLSLPNEATVFIFDFDRLRITPEKRLDLPELEFEIEITDEAFDSLDINIDEAIEIINSSKTLAL